MRSRLVVSGLIIVVAGLVFALQGSGYVGPPSSSMFMNPMWILLGSIIAATGIAISVVGGRWKKATPNR